MTQQMNVVPIQARDVIAVMAAFLNEKLKEEYSLKTASDWITKRAQEAWQIKEATHILKFTHPDAKCDPEQFAQNIRSSGNSVAGVGLVGTHCIDIEQYLDAAPSNAAALPVYALLRLRIGKESILDLAQKNDEALREAFKHFGTDPNVCIEAFAACREMPAHKASHRLTKQVYWPLKDSRYHLLGPLFPASLAHYLWKTINDDRYSDSANAAREARKAGIAHKHGFREYPELAIQNFGGSKPHNISQLNSERKGKNYLLPALPPNWQSPAIRPPFAVNSVFDRIFGNRPRVRELVRTLRDFLESVANYNNDPIRKKRAELTAYLCDEALLYAAELRDAVETGELAAGWTLDERCQLNRAEQLWLNPVRVEDDPDFASEYQRDEWPDEICRRFGNWLNARLTTDKLPMSAVEAEAWRSYMMEALAEHE